MSGKKCLKSVKEAALTPNERGIYLRTERRDMVTRRRNSFILGPRHMHARQIDVIVCRKFFIV